MNGGWLALVATGVLAAASGVSGVARNISAEAGRDDEGNVLVLLARGDTAVQGAQLEIQLPSADELRELLVELYPGINAESVQPDGPQPVGFLTGMDLPASYRVQGWGRAMLGAGMRKATEFGAREFYVLAMGDAVPFYKRLGFKVVSPSRTGPLMRLGLEDEDE